MTSSVGAPAWIGATAHDAVAAGCDGRVGSSTSPRARWPLRPTAAATGAGQVESVRGKAGGVEASLEGVPVRVLPAQLEQAFVEGLAGAVAGG